jgi:hypothetical protein
VAKIVLEVSAELKGLEAPLQALIAEAERRLVDGKAGRRVDYELFEQRLMERTAALELALHRAALAALDLDVERVLINDRGHVRVGRYPGEYGMQAGPVVVERSLYRPLGERNAPTVDLVTLRAGAISDGWLPGTARAMAHLLQQGTSREAQQTAQRLGRLPKPRSAGRPKKGAPKRSVARVFRMAYCGTVTLHDENGEAPHTLRYGAATPVR